MLYIVLVGIFVLWQVVVDKFCCENGLDYGLDDIVVVNGVKQIIFNVLMVMLNDGDEVILFVFYFVSYFEMVKLLGGVLVIVICFVEVGFCLMLQIFEVVIILCSKWLFLNMLGNLFGVVYSLDELVVLVVVLVCYLQIFVLLDEIYEYIIFDGCSFVSFGVVCLQMKDRMLIVNGVVKVYVMIGWWIGYVVGFVLLIKVMIMV